MVLGFIDSVDWKYFLIIFEVVDELKKKNYKVYSIEQTVSSIMLNEFIPLKGERLAIIFGNEVKGVQQEVIDASDGVIEIPQAGTKHSLNIAVSAGVVMWDLFQKLV